MPKKITIPKNEYWDNRKQQFVYTEETTIVIEHSLVSISKWEAKWHKPFLDGAEKTVEEVKDYIKCMTLTQNVNPLVYENLPKEALEEINNYLADPMTATWFREDKKPASRKVITSEVIYYWMIALNIPPEYQKWHINRLLTLIKVCNEENKPKKKSSMNDIYSRNNALNAARRAKSKSGG